jgi:hypothetical protein
LPCGFMKVRHYGFLSANSAVPIPTVRNLIDQRSGPALPQSLPEPPGPRCPNCGGPLVPLYSIWLARQSPPAPALRDTG